MKSLIFILFFVFINPFFLEAQLDEADACEIYSSVIDILKQQVKEKYQQKDLVLISTLLGDINFVKLIEIKYKFWGDSLIKNNIEYGKFNNYTNFEDINCNFENIKKICHCDYEWHYSKYMRKKICALYLSNIAYYDNYAFFHARIFISVFDAYDIFYFFKKDKNWELLFSYYF